MDKSFVWTRVAGSGVSPWVAHENLVLEIEESRIGEKRVV